jgi:hypothetical protein
VVKSVKFFIGNLVFLKKWHSGPFFHNLNCPLSPANQIIAPCKVQIKGLCGKKWKSDL